MIDSHLPSFERPPLDEVAAGVQFSPLPLKAAHVGRFHAAIAASYPSTMDVPPLPPAFETFGPMSPHEALQLQVFGGHLPRSWFISADDEHLVQLQCDRLIANWRLRSGKGVYPRFATIHRRFNEAVQLFIQFCNENGYGNLQPNQCDLTYFNKIPTGEGGWAGIGSLIRGMAPSFGPEWDGHVEDVRLVIRKVLVSASSSPIGRLTIEIGPGREANGDKIWTMNLTARGRPLTPDFDGVNLFLEMAHIEIVTSFAAVTTEHMHKKWGRLT